MIADTFEPNCTDHSNHVKPSLFERLAWPLQSSFLSTQTKVFAATMFTITRLFCSWTMVILGTHVKRMLTSQ
nr:hypothetical protein [Tanacetum cinerariifolium]